MSKTNTFEAQWLEHIFQNENISLIGDATGVQASSTAGSFYVSLHTADPGEAGDQEASEADYTSYARVAVARNNTAWTISGNRVSNGAAVQFPESTGGNNLITHFGVGTSTSGAGKLLYKGALTTSVTVTSGVQPQFTAGSLDITED